LIPGGPPLTDGTLAPGQVVPGHSVIAVTALEDPAIAPSTIDVETIVMTPEHPFYTAAGDWVPACRLHAADKVRKADGLYGVVRSVVLVPRLQVMYNLTVAGAHTYFVGDGQWLVHNCPTKYADFGDITTGQVKSGARKLQTGGHTIDARTRKTLGLTKDRAKAALEKLKEEFGFENDLHFEIWDDGSLVDPDTGEWIGNILLYLP